MALTAEQHAKREGKITASFLPSLMAGDVTKIINEWRRIIGDPNYVPDDLSIIWAVEFGSYIEPFALDWHQKKVGPLTRRGEFVLHPERPYFGSTLDAFRASDKTVIDCKAPGAFRKLDEVVAYYTPQMVGQRACVGADKAALLIVHGGAEPVEYPIAWEANYERELWDRVWHFQACVENLVPPAEMPAVAAPVAAVKTYDMTGNNNWGSAAATWLETKEHAQAFKSAEKTIKDAVPHDAVKCTGHHIVVSRNKAGSLSIKEAKGD
jgi:predicted phage-related endonuclease